MSPDSEPFPWLWPLTAGLQLGAATLEMMLGGAAQREGAATSSSIRSPSSASTKESS